MLHPVLWRPFFQALGWMGRPCLRQSRFPGGGTLKQSSHPFVRYPDHQRLRKIGNPCCWHKRFLSGGTALVR